MKHDKKRALKVVEFISLLHLVDDFYGQPFVLQDWQHKIICDVYGTVNDEGYRQYRYAYLEIPKKNAKTTTIAALGLYHLCADAPGGQIYCCAAEKGQAALTYQAAKGMIEQDEDLSALLKVIDSTKKIINRETGTFMQVLSAEAYSKHGLNPSVVIFDELHAQPNRELWDIMTFGAGASRKEPLWWVITTAGDDPDRKSIGWEIHDKAVKIRDGEINEPTWYVKIYAAPEDADIYDEAVWYAANPSLGVTMDITAVRQEANSARNSQASEKLFRWLRLNQWVALKRIGWLPLTLWDQTLGTWGKSDMLGRRCYVGVDLSSKIDLTAIALLFPPLDEAEEWRFMLQAWVPADNMKERVSRDHVKYDEWVDNGYLDATPGNVVDYAFIRSAIEAIDKQFDVVHYCGDPWHLEILRQLLPDNIQEKFIEISQTMAGMSQGMGELERLFRAKQITHEANPLGRWCFGNVIVAKDGNENIKPMKNKSIDRIDPIVALVDAAAAAVKLENQDTGWLGIAVV